MDFKKVNCEVGGLVNDNLKKLENIFPSVIKDGEVDFEELKELLGDFKEVDKEKYEMNWVGKREAKKIALTPLCGKTLKYIEGDGKNEDTTENLYIEGDNLEVLKLLQNSYYGKVKMIYIDPPYNTGNDFVYNDDFSEVKKDMEFINGHRDEYGNRLIKNQKESSYYHSKWLGMIYSRLIVAKNLLKEDGVIFISIDNNELDNLKKICDEVFGFENLETIFYIKVRHENRILREDIRYQLVMEQVLCYRKSSNYIPNRIEKEKKGEEYRYDIEVFDEPKEKLNIDGYIVEKYSTNSYKIKQQESGKGKFKKYQIRGSLISQHGSASEYYEKNLRNRRILDGDGTLYKVIGMGTKGDGLGYRYIMHPDNPETQNGFYFQGRPLNSKENIGLPYPNYYDFVAECNNVGYEGGIEFKNGKKPISLMKKLFEISKLSKCDNEIVLDFFSGSSTTAHAIMEFNLENSTKHKYIMVQLPENISINSVYNKEKFKNICEIGKERIRRAGEKILEENKDKEGIENLDIGFKVFRVENSNIRWENQLEEDGQIRYDLDGKNIDDIDFVPGTKDIDVVYEILLRHYGIPLTAKIEKLDFIGNRTYAIKDSIIVCLETQITKDIVDKISELEPLKVIFRDSAFGEDISLKQNSVHRLNVLIEKKNKNTTHVVEFI